MCRAFAYQYEHIEPTFANASSHDPDNICLLCGDHHYQVTQKLLSKEQVKKAYKRVQESEHIKSPFHSILLTGSLELTAGTSTFSHMTPVSAVLEYDGARILEIGYVEDEVCGGSRPSINGSVYDLEGTEIAAFEDNCLTVLNDPDDLELKKSLLTVKRGRAIALQIEFHPPNRIQIHKLNMKFGEIVCHLGPDFGISVPGAIFLTPMTHVLSADVWGAEAAISYKSNRNLWNWTDLPSFAASGVQLPKSGAILGKGGGKQLIRYHKMVPTRSSGSM